MSTTGVAYLLSGVVPEEVLDTKLYRITAVQSIYTCLGLGEEGIESI